VKYGIDTGFLVAVEMVEHPLHVSAQAKIAALVSVGDEFALAPQILAEFIHVVTALRRFTQPLNMEVARDLAQKWWTAKEVTQIFTVDIAVELFFSWHRKHGLGRKRLLDTLLASTYRNGGINSLLTTNPNDFAVLGGFQCVSPYIIGK